MIAKASVRRREAPFIPLSVALSSANVHLTQGRLGITLALFASMPSANCQRSSREIETPQKVIPDTMWVPDLQCEGTDLNSDQALVGIRSEALQQW
jgi:hypothetical protein